MKIGQAIRLLRVRRGYSLAALGESTGLSPSYLSLLETDRRQPPLDTLDKVAAGLGVSTPALILLATPPQDLQSVSDPTKQKLIEALFLLLTELNDAETELPQEADQKP